MKLKILLLTFIAACMVTAQSCCINYPTSTRDGDTVYDQICPEAIVLLTKANILGSESWRDPIGFQAGADFPLFFIHAPICLRAGTILSLQGAGWEYPDLEGKVNLWYAYLPIVLRYQHKSGFYGEAGLQPGFLLSAKDIYEGTTDNYMSHMNRFDLSVPIAVGYKFKNRIGINFKVIPGITDITQDEDEKDVNFVVGLGATYSFGSK